MRSPSTSSILSPPPLQPLPAKQIPHPHPLPPTPQPQPQPQQTQPAPQSQPHAQMSASKVHADLVLNWLTETFFLGSTGSLSKDTVFQEYLAMCASLQFKPVSSSVLGKLVHKGTFVFAFFLRHPLFSSRLDRISCPSSLACLHLFVFPVQFFEM